MNRTTALIGLCVLLAGCRTSAPPHEQQAAPPAELAAPTPVAAESPSPNSKPPIDEPIRFRLTKTAAYRGDILIYEDTEEYTEADEDGCESSDSTHYTALSRVGPVFSFASTSSYEEACGYPSTSFGQDTIDLRDGQAAPIDLLVEPASILAALKSSEELGSVVAAATSLDDAIKLLEAGDVLLTDYQFTSMSEDGTQVTMRFPYDDGEDEDRCLGCPDFTADLDLLVSPRPEYREAFAAAADGTDGFLRDNAPRFND